MRRTIAGAMMVCSLSGIAAAEEPQALAFTCEAPAIPSMSTSNEGLRRVEKRIALWAKCANDYLANDDSPAAHAMVQQVAEDISARRLKWLQNTVGFSNAQAASDLTQALGNLSQSRYATLPQGHYLRVVKPAESDGQVEQAAAAK